MGVFILSQTKITILRISIFTDITPPRINSTDTDFIIWNLKFIFNVSMSQWCIHSPATSLGTTLCGCVCVCAIILVLCFRARVCYWASILCFRASGSNDCSYSYRLSSAAWLLNWSVSESLPPNALQIVWESENVNLPDCLGLVLTAWKPSALIPWIHLL